jgi:DNA repair exonuclease SbcCD ATPase subunit
MEASMSQRVGKRSLDDQIAAAFLPDAVSAEVSELISDAEAAAAASGEAAQLARSQALDPALSAEKVATARREMEDAAFRRDRMHTAVTKLTERLHQLRAREEDHRRWLAYDKVKAERDKLAAELKEMYPTFTARLADLIARIDANDREVENINKRTRPNGAEWLAPAELVARGLKGFSDGVSNVPRITTDLRLPSFEYNRQALNLWPRS